VLLTTKVLIFFANRNIFVLFFLNLVSLCHLIGLDACKSVKINLLLQNKNYLKKATTSRSLNIQQKPERG